ncbi:MAG: LLM class flavin-dependent oxidoreductase [Candidatus Microthrix parvicella]
MAESTESTALDLGLALPTFLQFGAPDPGLVRSVAHEAETAGFDRLWCFDHILWHRPFIDALTATTIGLEATDRIAVGPGVLQALLRPPVVLAASLGSLIDVAEGRLGWGLGVGEHQREYDAAERLTAPTHRWDAMVEHHRAVAAALSTGGRSAPRPWIGGRGPGSQRAVAALGANWLTAFLGPSHFAAQFNRLSGLHIVPPMRGPFLFCCPPEHLESGRQWLESLYNLPGIGPRMVLPADERLAQRAGEFVQAGANHLSLVVTMDDPRAHLDQIVKLLSTVTGRSDHTTGGPHRG